MFRRFALLAACCVPLLAACGATQKAPQTSPTVDAKAQQQRVEAVRADCMKQKGFKYVAHVFQGFTRSEDDLKQATGDYAAMKEYRGKYGFGVYSPLIFPDKFGARAIRVDDENADPNWKIREGLPKGQQKAYDDAGETCYAQAVKEVYHKQVKGMFDHYDQARKAVEQTRKRELNGDPHLVELAATMASCLKSKGYRVDESQPTAVAEALRTQFSEEMRRVAKIESKESTSGNAAAVMTLDISPEKARPYLAKEVKAALDDLECGKAFYPVFLPKEGEINRRVYRDYGFGDMA
ncbi:hypothetical protein ACIBG8_20105 [Nonomuraea sp. NPDC050556]|uniref:hypothetical protein n=1 Tax=Nonomuraea sp. NPDC050556 TaxID=3364369 RepID=UPI003793E4CF